MTRPIEVEYIQQLASVISASPELYRKFKLGIQNGSIRNIGTAPPSNAQTASLTLNAELPRLHALTIGINNYQNHVYPTLKGCVADADAIETYLKSELAVPTSQITSLRDNRATREAIIRSIESFANNSAIQKHDAILIYFAGHGGEALSPVTWFSKGSRIQMLIPYDCGGMLEGQVIHGIPDRTIGALLKKIADAKGNNITVILDSCYAGSCTRATCSLSESSLVRSIVYTGDIPENLDYDFTKTLTCDVRKRGIQTAPGFLNVGLSSHVLLAACGSGERAREINGRGVFTKALLDTLQGLPIQQITYTDLLYRVGALSMQNPQCEGEHQNRFIFDARVPQRHRIVHICHWDPTTEDFNISAGSAHGVTIGSKFDVWKSTDHYMNWKRERPIGVIKVCEIGPFSSKASLISRSFDNLRVGSQFVAEQVECGEKPDLILHVPREGQMSRVFEALVREMLSPSLKRMDIQLSTAESAQINVVEDPEDTRRIAFEIKNPDINRHGLIRLPHSVSRDADPIHFHGIIHGIAHYEYHRRRSSAGQIRLANVPLSQGVQIELYRVNTFDPNSSADVLPPTSDNLVDDVNGIDLVQDGSWYMFKIRNDTRCDLYPALFYFDNCDLSVVSLYQPPTAGHNRVDPPLKAGQSLVIGYGGGSGSPFVFGVRQSVLELGFLKLFLTTEYVDFSDVEQASPFLTNNRGLRTFHRLSKTRSFWDSIMLPFVIRRTSPYQSELGSTQAGAIAVDLGKPLTMTMNPSSTWTSSFITDALVKSASQLAVSASHMASIVQPKVGRLMANNAGSILAVKIHQKHYTDTLSVTLRPEITSQIEMFISANAGVYTEKEITPTVIREDLSDIQDDLLELAKEQADGFEELRKIEKRLNSMRQKLLGCM